MPGLNVAPARNLTGDFHGLSNLLTSQLSLLQLLPHDLLQSLASASVVQLLQLLAALAKVAVLLLWVDYVTAVPGLLALDLLPQVLLALPELLLPLDLFLAALVVVVAAGVFFIDLDCGAVDGGIGHEEEEGEGS